MNRRVFVLAVGGLMGSALTMGEVKASSPTQLTHPKFGKYVEHWTSSVMRLYKNSFGKYCEKTLRYGLSIRYETGTAYYVSHNCSKDLISKIKAMTPNDFANMINSAKFMGPKDSVMVLPSRITFHHRSNS